MAVKYFYRHDGEGNIKAHEGPQKTEFRRLIPPLRAFAAKPAF
jgi:hypothetical protein